MREILFRGKRIDNGERIFGNLVRTDEGWYIIQNYVPRHMLPQCEVDPATVGQYTGLTDENGVKIFEGDYLCDWCEDENGSKSFCFFGVVTYWESEGRYVLADKNGLCNDWTLEDEAKPENWKHLTVRGNTREEAPHA